MAMQMGAVEAEDEVVASINTTPLVDVMLVLLIIFLITIPVVIQTIPVQLPKETNQPTQTKPENIIISVSREGEIYWNSLLMPDNAKLLARLKEVAVLVPQPEVHIRGDRNARYEAVGRVVYDCQRAAIMKVGFITEPPARGG
jgi:biopolymer transport protein ExbD